MRFLLRLFRPKPLSSDRSPPPLNSPPTRPAESATNPVPETVSPRNSGSKFDLLSLDVRFIAIDVETANEDTSSICQIGIAAVGHDNKIVTLCFMVNPEADFADFNIELHGIDETTVAHEPNLPEVLETLRPLLERFPLVQHSNFDKQALDAACARYGIPPLSATWHDSVTIARRAWPELTGNGGHGLANLKIVLNLDFQHHDAEDDAKAAAQIVLRAEQLTAQGFDDLSQRKPKSSYPAHVKIEGNESGPLHGEIACITGKLTMSRIEAAAIAAEAGITIKASISAKVTLLVVGDQDLALLAGHSKSSKHRRAEEMIAKGHKIRIIGETEFMALVKA